MYSYLSSGHPVRWGPTWSWHSTRTSAALERCVPVVTDISCKAVPNSKSWTPSLMYWTVIPNYTAPHQMRAYVYIQGRLKDLWQCVWHLLLGNWIQAGTGGEPESQNNRCTPTLHHKITDTITKGVTVRCTSTHTFTGTLNRYQGANEWRKHVAGGEWKFFCSVSKEKGTKAGVHYNLPVSWNPRMLRHPEAKYDHILFCMFPKP